MKRGLSFKPGNTSGRGRPKGSRNKATLEREALLEEYAPGILKKCMAEALKGEKVALRLCIERIMPPARHQTAAIKLPPIRSAADLLLASAAILKAAADGTIAVADAEGFQRLLESHQRQLGSQELTLRIEALEQRGMGATAVELVSEDRNGRAGKAVLAEEPNDAQ